jgi:signal transduction histidine kinase
MLWTWRAARDFLTPIPDARLPELIAHRRTGMRIGTLGALVLPPGSPGYMLVEVLRGAARPLPGLVLGLASGAAFLTLFWASLRPWWERHLDTIQVLTCLTLLLSCGLLGWAQPTGVAPILGIMVVLPVIAVLFVPCRPLMAVSLGLPTLAAVLLARSIVAGELGRLDATTIILTLAFAVTAGLASQVTRRVWLNLAQVRAQLVAAEAMSNLGRMTAGVAHELKTPLAAVQNQVEEARLLVEELDASIGNAEVTENDLRELASELSVAVVGIGAASERAMSFVHAIREHSRSVGERADRRFRIADRVAAVTSLLSYRLRRSSVSIDVSGVDPALELHGDPGRFDQVMSNLIGNSLDEYEVAGRGGVIRIATASGEKGISISVDDDGRGISDAAAERVFEPLFTTKGETGGTGLGLAIARDLARTVFAGDLTLARRYPGARFELLCADAPQAGRAIAVTQSIT